MFVDRLVILCVESVGDSVAFFFSATTFPTDFGVFRSFLPVFGALTSSFGTLGEVVEGAATTAVVRTGAFQSTGLPAGPELGSARTASGIFLRCKDDGGN